MSGGSSAGASAPGVLYVVATPIGNLDDMTRRAAAVLGEVDTVAAEDTRRARVLLAAWGIRARTVSYHDFSGPRAVGRLIDRLLSGRSVALIADAGTPLIADPGFRLVRAARERGLKVAPVPGPSALAAALSVAGLPTDRFAFEGFLPSRDGARRARLEELALEPRTMVFYESPRRLARSLEAMAGAFGEGRALFLARELTKRFEQHFSGSVGECREWLAADADRGRGEFVLVVAGCDEAAAAARERRKARDMLDELRGVMPLRRAVDFAARFTGANRNRLYEVALEARDGAPGGSKADGGGDGR